jgi:hypothetical protein
MNCWSNYCKCVRGGTCECGCQVWHSRRFMQSFKGSSIRSFAGKPCRAVAKIVRCLQGPCPDPHPARSALLHHSYFTRNDHHDTQLHRCTLPRLASCAVALHATSFIALRTRTTIDSQLSAVCSPYVIPLCLGAGRFDDQLSTASTCHDNTCLGPALHAAG